LESPHDDRFSSKYLNLAEERLGTVVLETTDDFFCGEILISKTGNIKNPLICPTLPRFA